MAENKEIRQLQIEYRTTEGSRKIEGVAIVFNQLSEDLGGFREMIIPDAVQNVIEQSDIFSKDKFGIAMATSWWSKVLLICSAFKA